MPIWNLVKKQKNSFNFLFEKLNKLVNIKLVSLLPLWGDKMSKGQRHIKIREIIANNDIETQDDLVFH